MAADLWGISPTSGRAHRSFLPLSPEIWNKPAEDYPLDGIDLLPIVRGASPVHDRTFFWRIYNQDAVRQGKWKYVRDGARRQLFDLSFDQHEQADFSQRNPEVFAQLAAEFDKWNRQMLPRIVR